MRRLLPVRPPNAAVRAAATGGGGGGANGGVTATAAPAATGAAAPPPPPRGSSKPPPQPSRPTSPGTVVVDYYGFELHDLTQQQRDDRDGAAVRATRRAARWAPHALAGALPRSAPTLRRFCRKGVPPELRGWVWFEASGARRRAELAGPGAFARLAALAEDRQPEVARQVDLDLPRTFPLNASISSRSGLAALRRVLLASAARRPSQGYCQGLNFVAAMLLLVVEGSTGDPSTSGSAEASAERAFWLLDALVGGGPPDGSLGGSARGILYPGTFAPALEGCHVEMRAFGALLAKKNARLSRHFAAVGCDVSLLATDWFLCLLCTCLPSETCARVWDAMFADGHPKALYRAALALMRREEAALLAAEHPGDVLRAFRAAAARAHDRDALLRECWAPRRVGRLPMAGIDALREAARPGVEAMAAERQQRARGGKGALSKVIEQGRRAQAQAATTMMGATTGGATAAATAATAATTATAAATTSGGGGGGGGGDPGPAGGRLSPLLPHQQQREEERRREARLREPGGEEASWGASAWADDAERFGSARR